MIGFALGWLRNRHRWSPWRPHGSGMLFVMIRHCTKCGLEESKIVVL